MRFTTVLGAAALGLALPTFALAQPSSATAPTTSAPASRIPPADSAAAPTPPSTPDRAPGSPDTGAPAAAAAPSAGVNTAATISAGMTVKDKNGATIGQVADVKADASGKQTATIKMGADQFAVDTSALAVDNGSATINATQDEIRAMMKKGHK